MQLSKLRFNFSQTSIMKMAFQMKPTLRSKIGLSHEYKHCSNYHSRCVKGVFITSQPSHTLVIHDCKHKHIYKSTFHVTRYRNDMKFHMLMFMNAWMMLVLMKYKCQLQCLTQRCYIPSPL